MKYYFLELILQHAKKFIIWLLVLEARLVVFIKNPLIIVVIGSVGKTTTKDMIYEVVKKISPTRKSEKSYNGEIGVPLTILNQKNPWSNPLDWLLVLLKGFIVLFQREYPKILVLELGADKPGSIKNLAKFLKPDVAVLTRLPEIPVHNQAFTSRYELYAEKTSILKYVKKNGVVIYNNDDKHLRKIISDCEFERLITYGFEEGATVKGDYWGIEYDKRLPIGMHTRILIGKEQMNVYLRDVLGIQFSYAILASMAVGQTFELSPHKSVELLKSYVPSNGRMKILPGIRNSIIIDDTYNASPIAAEKALEVLSNIETKGRRIVVFGDMAELGPLSDKAHQKVCKIADNTSDIAIVVGPIFERAMCDGGFDKFIYVSNINNVGVKLKEIIKEGDTFLIKGSQSMRLEKAVAEILDSSVDPKKVLVRQEKEWMFR